MDYPRWLLREEGWWPRGARAASGGMGSAGIRGRSPVPGTTGNGRLPAPPTRFPTAAIARFLPTIDATSRTLESLSPWVLGFLGPFGSSRFLPTTDATLRTLVLRPLPSVLTVRTSRTITSTRMIVGSFCRNRGSSCRDWVRFARPSSLAAPDRLPNWQRWLRFGGRAPTRPPAHPAGGLVE